MKMIRDNLVKGILIGFIGVFFVCCISNLAEAIVTPGNFYNGGGIPPAHQSDDDDNNNSSYNPAPNPTIDARNYHYNLYGNSSSSDNSQGSSKPNDITTWYTPPESTPNVPEVPSGYNYNQYNGAGGFEENYEQGSSATGEIEILQSSIPPLVPADVVVWDEWETNLVDDLEGDIDIHIEDNIVETKVYDAATETFTVNTYQYDTNYNPDVDIEEDTEIEISEDLIDTGLTQEEIVNGNWILVEQQVIEDVTSVDWKEVDSEDTEEEQSGVYYTEADGEDIEITIGTVIENNEGSGELPPDDQEAMVQTVAYNGEEMQLVDVSGVEIDFDESFNLDYRLDGEIVLCGFEPEYPVAPEVEEAYNSLIPQFDMVQADMTLEEFAKAYNERQEVTITEEDFPWVTEVEEGKKLYEMQVETINGGTKTIYLDADNNIVLETQPTGRGTILALEYGEKEEGEVYPDGTRGVSIGRVGGGEINEEGNYVVVDADGNVIEGASVEKDEEGNIVVVDEEGKEIPGAVPSLMVDSNQSEINFVVNEDGTMQYKGGTVILNGNGFSYVVKGKAHHEDDDGQMDVYTETFEVYNSEGKKVSSGKTEYSKIGADNWGVTLVIKDGADNYDDSENAMRITYEDTDGDGVMDTRTIEEKTLNEEGELVTAEATEVVVEGSFEEGTIEITGTRIDQETGAVKTIEGTVERKVTDKGTVDTLTTTIETTREEKVAQMSVLGISEAQAGKIVDELEADNIEGAIDIMKEMFPDATVEQIEEFLKGIKEKEVNEVLTYDKNGSLQSVKEDSDGDDIPDDEDPNPNTPDEPGAAGQGEIDKTPIENVTEQSIAAVKKTLAELFPNMVDDAILKLIEYAISGDYESFRSSLIGQTIVLPDGEGNSQEYTITEENIDNIDGKGTGAKQIWDYIRGVLKGESSGSQQPGAAAAARPGGAGGGGTHSGDEDDDGGWDSTKAANELADATDDAERDWSDEHSTLQNRTRALKESGVISEEDKQTIDNMTDYDAKISLARELYLKAMGVRGDLAKKIAGMDDGEARAMLKAMGFTDAEIEDFLAKETEAEKEKFLNEHGLNEKQEEIFEAMFSEDSDYFYSEKKDFLKGLGLNQEQAKEVIDMLNDPESTEDDVKKYINDTDYADFSWDDYSKLSDENKEMYLSVLGMSEEQIDGVLAKGDNQAEVEEYIGSIDKFSETQINELFDLRSEDMQEAYLMGLGLSDNQSYDVYSADKEEGRKNYLENIAGLPEWVAGYIVDPDRSFSEVNDIIEKIETAAEELGVTGSDEDETLFAGIGAELWEYLLSGVDTGEGTLWVTSDSSNEEVKAFLEAFLEETGHEDIY